MPNGLTCPSFDSSVHDGPGRHQIVESASDLVTSGRPGSPGRDQIGSALDDLMPTRPIVDGGVDEGQVRPLGTASPITTYFRVCDGPA